MPFNLAKAKKRSMVHIKLVGIFLLFAERYLSFAIHHSSCRVTLLVVVE
jgi:hypothetical protein